ncbi:MAG: DUF1289 domain-containing protein [Proteobacteria bacterium]|nr:DUF1289 domain-containing protein [Pseudomonadota bacterium]
MARHSPCIGICKLDDATGFCLGCGRTGAEVGDWISMSETQRDAVWAALPQRLAALSVRVRLLPWIRDELVDWVRDSIVARQGTWVIGAPGAFGEFPTMGDAPIDVCVEGGVVTAKRADAAFRLAINEKVRAFAFAEGAPIVLGLPRGRAAMPSSASLQSLGPDTGAIDAVRRGDLLFDIGIGRRYTRFCVRTGNQALISSLSALDRRHWSDFMPVMLPQLIAVSAHRVVESSSGRIEVFAPIPGPEQTSTNGACTHFLPEFLKSGEDIPRVLAPPDYAAPVAIFYPNKI